MFIFPSPHKSIFIFRGLIGLKLKIFWEVAKIIHWWFTIYFFCTTSGCIWHMVVRLLVMLKLIQVLLAWSIHYKSYPSIIHLMVLVAIEDCYLNLLFYEELKMTIFNFIIPFTFVRWKYFIQKDFSLTTLCLF